jgi:hypothetical protein
MIDKGVENNYAIAREIPCMIDKEVENNYAAACCPLGAGSRALTTRDRFGGVG